MDKVINKISEIESAAVSVMDDANARKKAFAQEMEQRTLKFDADLEAETMKQLNDLKANMEIAMKEKLSQQKSNAEKVREDLEKNYQKNHTKYAKELFDAMIKE